MTRSGESLAVGLDPHGSSVTRGSIGTADQAADTLLTKRQVAQTLNTSVRTVERRVASGALPAIRSSARVIRFDPADVAAYVAACRMGPDADDHSTRGGVSGAVAH